MSTRDTTSDPASFETFEHLVVVMFENRSFDSLLGYLYSPGAVPRTKRLMAWPVPSIAIPCPPTSTTETLTYRRA